MYKLISTDEFMDWLDNLRDRAAYMCISARLVRAEHGNLGDYKSVGGGLHEMRLDFGPGYRLYFQQREMFLVLLLCGGDKSSQALDIVRARMLASNIPDDPNWFLDEEE